MLSPEDMTQFPALVWQRSVLPKVKKAVVFMDDRCVETLHWCGGAAALLEAGARNLKQFSSFEAGAENEPKAVFVVGGLLKGRTVDVIRDIISLSHFQYVVVVTAVSHSVHLLANGVTGAEPEGAPVFQQFEEKLCEWMGNMNYTAEVLHAPVAFAPLSQQLLLLPGHAHLFPLLPSDLDAINARRPEKKKFSSVDDLDLNALTPELQIHIKALTSALSSLLDATGIREENFAVGPMSRIIAGELSSHPQAKSRRKTAQNKASIVFIDRTLDLTGAVGHHGDGLLEKMLTVLDPLPGHVTDVQVDMLELTGVQRTHHSRDAVAPGCLAQTQSPAARSLWESMLISKQKEAVMEVRRHLVEAASREKLPIKMSMGRVTSDQLCSYIQLFRSSPVALENHVSVLQLGLASAQTLRHPALRRWDACLAVERLLLQALGDSDFPSVLRQLIPLMKPRGGGGRDGVEGAGPTFSEDECGPDELILLLVYLYSLAEEEQEEEQEEQQEQLERELIGALTLVITREAELSPLLRKLTGCDLPEEVTTDRVHRAVSRMFEVLRTLSHTREKMKKLRSVYTAGDGGHQASYRPFLRQVLEEVLDADRQDSPDVEHMSGGLTDLLKTGFSMFMKVTRPHPADNSLLLLFLVGGVTTSELRLLRETVNAHKPGTQVLVLSTRLLRPTDIPELLFSTQRLNPDIGV